MADRDRIQPVATVASEDTSHPSNYEKHLPKNAKDHDVDQEERARKLAQEDFYTRKKQNYSGLTLAWLAFQSTGTIYGDIGTSPLYVYSSTFTSQPSWDDLVGALSIIIWSITLIVTVKYTFIVLSADDDGQGGTFALYSLLARFARITTRDPNMAFSPKLERHDTGEMDVVGKNFRTFLEKSSVAKFCLKVTGVVGVSMVIADGVLTPAQSVLGAIQGITVADPTLTRSAIVGISCAILVFLFAIQPFGTAKLGTTFAPVVVIWLLFNFCSGVYNLVLYDHTVLKAFSPYYAGAYLVRNGHDGWRSLGGLLLAFTGVEALFADLGAFSKRAIQISWLGLAFPCLLIAYAGQAAFIAADATETAFTNPFFYTVPPGSFYFSMVIAVLAAIVASQAMITSSFQLLTQVMRLSYFPHIKTVHTSAKFHEQVYMPFANWLLMIGTVVVTAVYNNTTSLGNAYGVCVIVVTFITTCMVSMVAIVSWRIPSYIVLFLFLIFGALDGAYISSSLVKVPDGAWFTILLAFILSTIFVLWRFGKEAQWSAEGSNPISPSALLTRTASSELVLKPEFGGQKVSNASGLGIFFDKVGGPDHVPMVFTQFVRKFKTRPTIVLFFHLRPLSKPTVAPEERYIITRVREIPSCYRVTLRHGYMDDVLTPNLGQQLVEHLVLYITRDHSVSSDGSAKSVEHTPEIQAELDALNQAVDEQMVYIIGKEVMKVNKGRKMGAGWFRWLVLETFLWIRENSRAKLANLDIDADRLVEVGFVKVI
ncbi:potassium transporter-domain-containing protein [Podospora australis]|uniref:Potassium transporter-domain-containing protein n=1 Tax=Podospora australis TaxID=1536484 RepID=A0AAN6WRG6_9PEZI|nr:potassium transporter-domain-containing protein [Podospora australis]